MFVHQDARGQVEIAFTDRHGGLSGGPFASLNLGHAAGDDEDVVLANLTLVARAMEHTPGQTGRPVGGGPGAGPPVALMRQVHGDTVHVVAPGRVGEVPEADALVTVHAGVILAARAADCLPLLIADEEAGVVAAAHAGREGMRAGVVGATLEAMHELGARRVHAWIGPHICGACYEVPESMRAEVALELPEAAGETSWGTPSLDLARGVGSQLAAAGPRRPVVTEIVRAGGCTREDPDLFSYRRQGGASGRLAGLIWRRP